MTSGERFADDLVRQLVRAAIVLKIESSFAPEVAEVTAESEILGSIVAKYFRNAGRKIAETAYAAFDDAGLTVEALAFSELWRRSHPEQDDLWETEDDGLN
ncbi:MAG: hypothetical protein KGI33_11935 [Thaumarchaeota archaeon]|nr:hypothetical protein [Nitrososphaerota archaeon]